MSLKPQWLAISALLRGSAQNATILSWRATWGGTPQVSISFGIPNRCIEHKRFHTVLWLRQPRRFHDLVESIHTFTKLLHIFVLMQELCNFRIAREMDVPHIVQPHDTGQRTGAFYRQPVVEHLDLDIRPFDAVIAMCNGVDRSGA